MKARILKILMYVLAYSSLGYTIICGGYIAMPEEIQALIPEFNWMTALVSGGTTSIVATTLLTVDYFMRKTKKDTESKYSLLAEKYLEIKTAYAKMTETLNATIIKIDSLTALNTHLNRKVDIELQAKLSNPLVDAKVKELIEEIKGAEVSG